jgi:hypothetical protein
LQRAQSGEDQQGYEITLTREWVIRLAPVIKMGIFVTRVALAYFGVMLPDMLSLPQAQSNSLDVLTELLDSCLSDETSLIDEILSKSHSLSDIYKQFESNKQFLITAEIGFREVYHLLYSIEVDREERLLPGNWTPKFTGLVLVHSPADGSSEWVHESVVSQYKISGSSLLHQHPLPLPPSSERPQLPPPPPSPRPPAITSPPRLQIQDAPSASQIPSPTSPHPPPEQSLGIPSSSTPLLNEDQDDIILTTDPTQIVCEVIPIEKKAPTSCCLVM